ncbi:hypothetical protein CKA32_001629 [Geitlerinema sp. FC II]|nr:hypothetical protein [Geitlerinema sp. CS-897]PPT08744.1 hypothetical protein CKA32_001629 [Geitlerinema sp. FC II]
MPVESHDFQRSPLRDRLAQIGLLRFVARAKPKSPAIVKHYLVRERGTESCRLGFPQ